MNTAKRYLGFLWLALGVYAGYFSIASIGWPKLMSGFSGNTSDLVFGLITMGVLTPLIVASLLVFGYFAVRGEYTKGSPAETYNTEERRAKN